MPQPMNTVFSAQMARNWWQVLLRGVISIAAGLLVFAYPAQAIKVVVLLFALYVLTDSLLGLLSARQRPAASGALLGLWFLLGVFVAIHTFYRPDTTTRVLLLLVAAWAIYTGVMQLLTALRLRRVLAGEWTMLAAGSASIVLGLVMLFSPASAITTVRWLIAGYAVLLGVLLLILSLQLRQLRRLPIAP